MLVIAHRGTHSEAPENSMEAFEMAIAQGADGIELDVRSTADGVPIVMHDPSLKRTTGRKTKVSQATYAHVSLAKLANGKAIPTLDDVLSAFANKTILYLELKDRKSSREAERLVAKHPSAKVTVSSFDSRALAGAKGLPKALLWDKRGSPVKSAIKLGCVEIHPRLRRLTARMVKEAHAVGLHVVAWNIKNARDVRAASRMGLDGIIVDDVAMARATLFK